MKLQRFIYISFIFLGLAFASATHAFNMGNMMSPSRWMGNNNDNDRYDDDYYDRGYGYGGAPGYGYGGVPGYGYGGVPGYGYGSVPGYGYGSAPGYGTAPGYGGAPAYNAPGSNSDAKEIKRLQDRIKKLEESNRRNEGSNW